ncbi:hypothetical protein UA08_02948 [Talaromyces atroroseus]|uniref:Maintenance of telomere capping protein 6 n=1 Tax=Talaromyces atroroseus TaxID=1441469 RepID=A0A225B9C0_TALAT|nr:hypothetical protein UA08_02948 [Talaromyces atroroseus]OKL62557.1 hypothetical protein UA08_02948 [Talaromyces atroroseus]
MSGAYTSDFALLNDTFWVDLLSQRDVSAQVPINFVARPSIALTAACFGDNSYNGDAASLCLSDLLTVGYFRFIIDVYWSHQNLQWLLCPVSFPTSNASNGSEYTLGSYTCSNSFSITTLLDVLNNYIQDTNSELESTFLHVIINMHAAADSDNPDGPAPSLSAASLPSESSLLGTVADKVMGSYIYTPPELAQERRDLNKSWFHDTKMWTTVLSDYFTTVNDAHGVQSTPDGWPCESYLINKASKRLLFGRGSVDPQLQSYNFTGDDAFIFPSDDVEDIISVSNTPDGSGLQSGCFFNPRNTNLQNVNNSWALASVNTSYSSFLLQNYTSCGISPLVNETLYGQTADANIDPYRNLSMSATWSWAVGEPRNATSLPGYTELTDTSEVLRCAMMDPSSGGHWRAGNCSDEYRAACRVTNEPYLWTLSEDTHSFSGSSNACPSNSFFDVPRTGLENTYFYHQAVSEVGSTSASEPIWVNLNSMDVEYCWVLGGANATCIYTEGSNDVGHRTILVPTIAAIIILTITASTIFVKCNSNRRISRRKRVNEGWEYEGVPS